jgi:hypothetical protein
MPLYTAFVPHNLNPEGLRRLAILRLTEALVLISTWPFMRSFCRPIRGTRPLLSGIGMKLAMTVNADPTPCSHEYTCLK